MPMRYGPKENCDRQTL